MRECDSIQQLKKERDYLSGQLEEATKELTRLDMLNLTLTRQKKQALGAFHLIRALHGKLEQAFNIGDLYYNAVTVLTSELSMDASAVLKINHETREISILASVGLPFPENIKLKLDKGFTKEEFLVPTFVNSKSSRRPFQEFIRSHFAFPYFGWYPIVDEGNGTLVLYAGNKCEDLVSRQPFSEESLETFGAISSVILLRRDNIAKTREILRKKEERIDFLAEILKTSPISVVSTDKDENITYCNPAMEKLLGYKETELLGKHPAMLNAEPNAASIEKEIRDTVRRGGVWRGEIQCRKKNGDLFYNHLSVYQIRDREGNFIAMVGFQEDVTDRKRAEGALKESEEKYRAIFENTGTATIIIEEDTTISLANAEFARFIGYSKEELEGKKSWMEFVAEDDLARSKEYHDARRIDPDAAPMKYELKIADRQGNVRETIATVDLIPGTKKSVASALDITERKRTTEALEESERRYRLLAENVTDVIWTMDLDLQFTYFSPSIRLLLGYGAEEAIALSVEQILTSPSLDVALAAFEEEMALEKKGTGDSSRSRVLELELNCKDGSTVWAETKVTFLRDSAGRPFGILGVARNIAERKQAEEAIKQRNRELSVLNAVACTVSQSLEIDSILDEALKKLLDLLAIDTAAIRLNHEAKWRFSFVANCRTSKRLRKMVNDIPLEGRTLRPVLEGGKPTILDAWPTSEGGKRHAAKERFAAIPLLSKGMVNGILLVHKDTNSTFSPDEIELFTTVGNQIAIAVDNAWLYQELKKQWIFTTTLIETMPDGMGVLDEKGQVEFANRHLLQLLGYSLQEYLGMHWTSLIHPGDHSSVRTQRKSRRSARPSTYECRLIRKDGAAIPVLISWAPRFNGQRQYQGTIGIVTDITERKEAEEALRRSEGEKDAILNSMLELVVYQNTNHSIVWANRVAHESVGLTADQLLGRHCYEIWQGRGEPCIGCPVGKARETGQPQEGQMDSPDGRSWFIRSYPVRDANDDITGVVEVMLDITENKRTEEKLREYEARYTYLLDNMPDGVALTHRRQFIRVNPSMAQMFGYPAPESMEGLSLWDIAVPGSKKIMRQQSTSKVLGEQGENRFEFEALRKDGSTFPAEVTLTVDRSEPHPFVLAFIRDVTERKAYEEQRKRLSERIITVQERERASIARELHDELGQALTGIKMDMAWVKSHIKDIDTTISERLKALGELIDTTLESVREMAGSLHPSVLDRLGLSAAIEWYAGEFERRTGIECIIEGESWDFSIDNNTAIHVYRILQEALTNIARHAKASRVDIRIAQDQGYVAISVSDNGRGIPPQKLVEPISLGIAGMRERVELIKGRLDIQSRRGKGTTVTVQMPASP
jgi:PAS domain S-box-containing protein